MDQDRAAEAMLADTVTAALLVALDALAPAERLAFVLHEVFAVTFDQIASIIGQTPEAARRLVTDARRRVQNPTSWSP
jgi:DNA-directed RNA polymerase specialized sigma24 family protein